MHRALIVLAFAIAARGGVTTDHPQVDGSIDDATSPDASDDAAIHFGDDASALPPVRPCPTSEPAAGTPCASQKNLCEYGSSSNVLCNTIYSCFQGDWVLFQGTGACPVMAACPSDIDGGACATDFARCEYPEAGRDCMCSACGAGPGGSGTQWACFSPGPDCPLARPNLGTVCTIADGGSCKYSPGTCCSGVVLRCESGVWDGEITRECP